MLDIYMSIIFVVFCTGATISTLGLSALSICILILVIKDIYN